MMTKHFITCLLFCFTVVMNDCYSETHLRDNLPRARVGDYIVTSQNRTNTLLVVTDKNDSVIRIQEITIAEGRFPTYICSWREWLRQDAPGHSSWVIYDLNPRNGQLIQAFSYTKNGWMDGAPTETYIGTLLNLTLEPLPTKQRRRVGRGNVDSQDSRGYWQPRLVVEGEVVPYAAFTAWRARWPNDGSELAGKSIELYLPAVEGNYPSYFPYWVQVSGIVGKARMRIIDSGTGLISPISAMPQRS